MRRIRKTVPPLPLELWSLIACHTRSRRSDLLALALVSQMHLNAARPVLFRHVKLHRARGTNGAVNREYQLLLKLLGENGGVLARTVERLKVEILPPSIVSGQREDSAESEPPPIPLDIIAYMSNLRELVWGHSFLLSKQHFEPYIQDFVTVLNARCPLLKTLDFEQGSYYVAQTPMTLKYLERLTWSTSGDLFNDPFSSRTLISLLKSSSSTLKQMILPSSMSDDVAHPFITLATSAFFPALKTLVLGQWNTFHIQQTELGEIIASFLYKHPTIERLHLRWDSKITFPTIISWGTLFPIIDIRGARSVFDQAKFLPNLHSLNVHAKQLMFLAKRVPTCLRNLTALRFGIPDEVHEDFYDDDEDDDDDDTVGYMTNLLSALKEIGGLPNLKVLHLECDPSGVYSRRFLRYMEDFSSISPGLERWEGNFPSPMTMISLTRSFKNFLCLREIQIISFVGDIILESDSEQPEIISAARALANLCPNMRRFEMLIDPGAFNGSRTIRRLGENERAWQMDAYTNSVVLIDVLELETSFRAHEEDVGPGNLKFWGW